MTEKDATRRLLELGYKTMEKAYHRRQLAGMGDIPYLVSVFEKGDLPMVYIIRMNGEAADLSLDLLVYNRNAVGVAEALEVLEHCP